MKCNFSNSIAKSSRFSWNTWNTVFHVFYVFHVSISYAKSKYIERQEKGKRI